MKASVFTCQRCGTPLELPRDPRLLHVDCRYCGTDNILPPELIHARQRQHEFDVAHQVKAEAAARDAAVQKATARGSFWVGLMVVAVLLAVVALVVALEAREAYLDRKVQALAADPRHNGQTATLTRLEGMKHGKGCERILVQPAVYTANSNISLNMVDGDFCVHILAVSGTGAPLSLRYTTPQVALKQAVPPAGPVIDYRLCPEITANQSFDVVTTGQAPFTTAVIECPRTVAEGAARSKEDKPETTGVARTKSKLDALFKAGCGYVVSQPSALKGPQTITFNSKEKGPCLSVLASSAYPDVTLKATLNAPDNVILPVPEPAQDLRVHYCPTQTGAYKLTVTPSSRDHYGQAALDCPRASREGLRREQEFRRPLSK